MSLLVQKLRELRFFANLKFPILENRGCLEGEKGQSYTAEKAAARLVLNNIWQILFFSGTLNFSDVIFVPKERTCSGLQKHVNILKIEQFSVNLESIIISAPCFWVTR